MSHRTEISRDLEDLDFWGTPNPNDPHKEGGGDIGRERDLGGILPRESDHFTASVLQQWSVCGLRGRYLMRPNPAFPGIETSSYGADIRLDGKEFEESLISHPKIWQPLLRKNLIDSNGDHFLPQTPGKREIELVDLDKIKRIGKKGAAERHLEIVRGIYQERGPIPTLFYQMRIDVNDSILRTLNPSDFEEKSGDDITEGTGEGTGEGRDEEAGGRKLGTGAIDLLLWTGSTFILGEVKLTTNPKEQTAYQLIYYRSFLQDQGLPISDWSFVFHCKAGWKYDRSRNARFRNRCLNNTQILTFRLQHSLPGYEELMSKVREFHQSDTTAIDEKDIETLCHLRPSCPECRHRDRCYERFASQHDPTLDKAGLDEAEIEVLKSFGIHTVSEGISALKNPKSLLVSLYRHHPDRLAELNRRLRTTLRLGGFSSWVPPLSKEKVPLRDEQILISVRGVWTHPGEKSGEPIDLQTVIPTLENKDIAIVTFTEAEAEEARGFLKRLTNSIMGRVTMKIQSVILEKEVEQRVTFPLPNLTLRGISNCLNSIVTEGSWHAYYDGPIARDYFMKEDHDPEATIETKTVTRLNNLVTLYRALVHLHTIANEEGEKKS
jgi:hypothetical protein